MATERIDEVYLSKNFLKKFKYPKRESLHIKAVRKHHGCKFVELLFEREEFKMNEKIADGLEQAAPYSIC